MTLVVVSELELLSEVATEEEAAPLTLEGPAGLRRLGETQAPAAARSTRSGRPPRVRP